MAALTFLGIESSCDETAAAIVKRSDNGAGTIVSNVVLSQVDEHAAFGGVVPEIAARAHVSALDGVIERALQDSGLDFADLDGIAVTAGPGLIGGLIVGLMTAKAIAAVHNVPLVPVNHLEGHALTAALTDGARFPYLLLLASGGHTQLILVEDVGQYRRLGSTIDDAAGEAFDKIAKMLQLGQPGGPCVERYAVEGDGTRFAFPRPLRGSQNCNFSFSGLKTAVRQAALGLEPISNQDRADLCASFQNAVADSFCEKTVYAIRTLREEKIPITALVVAGGVASNQAIRERLRGACADEDLDFIAPPISLCTDNAAMVAWAGANRLALGLPYDPDMSARSRWPLDENSAPMIGSGRLGARV